MARVVEHAWVPAAANARQHVRHHRAKAGPGHGLARAHAREVGPAPGDQRIDALGANVAVVAVVFGCAGNAEAGCAEAARHDLGGIVQKAHLGRGLLVLLVRELDGDGVALDRVDVDAVAEHAALITRIATLRPDAVFAFFAGGGAVKFVKDYSAAGLNRTIPLYGAGFLTDGTLQALGADANGVRTTLHYADDLDNAANRAFLEAFKARTGQDGDIYAVQGWDAATLLGEGLKATNGDWSARARVTAAMRAARIDSPRGPLSFNRAGNPVQNIYLREVRDGRNALVSIAGQAVDDPARGCRATS